MSVKVKKIGDDANNRIMVRLDTTKLDMIERELGRCFAAQVGVLGVKASGRMNIKHERVGGPKMNRKAPVVQGDSNATNAYIGLIHEKGWTPKNIPRRSFLEVPLTTKMPGIMARVGRMILEGIEASNIELAYRKLATVAEGVVLQAFSTGGYGRWPAKKNNEPSHLIDTGQLRQSISSRVVTK